MYWWMQREWRKRHWRSKNSEKNRRKNCEEEVRKNLIFPESGGQSPKEKRLQSVYDKKTESKSKSKKLMTKNNRAS